MGVAPVTVKEIGDFVQSIFYAFDDYIFYAFCMMATFFIGFYIKAIILGRYDL